jgi:hypothetical protein
MNVQLHFFVYTISFAVCFHFSSKHTTICPFDIYMLLHCYLFTDLLTDSGDVAKSLFSTLFLTTSASISLLEEELLPLFPCRRTR